MPIFISRFSPERSLVGNFLAPRARQTGNEGTSPQSRTRRGGQNRSTEVQQDRLELSQGQPPSASQATAQVSTTPTAPAAPAQSVTETSTAAADVSTSTATATAPQAGEVAGRPASETDTPASSAGSRLRNLARSLFGATAAESEADGPGLANLVLSIREENISAAETADPDRVETLAAEMDSDAEAAEAAAAAAGAGGLPGDDAPGDGGDGGDSAAVGEDSAVESAVGEDSPKAAPLAAATEGMQHA